MHDGSVDPTVAGCVRCDVMCWCIPDARRLLCVVACMRGVLGLLAASVSDDGKVQPRSSRFVALLVLVPILGGYQGSVPTPVYT